MAGRGTFNSSIDVANANVSQFSCTEASPNYQTIISGVDPLEMQEGVETGLIGPGTAFARAYVTAKPGRKVLLVPVAHGSTALVGSTWASGNPGGALYENAIAQANAALTAALLVHPTSRVAGIGWLQGESDGNVAQATYAAALDAVIAGFRARMTGAANTWFAVLGMVPEYIATTNNNVNAAHIDTPNRNARCTFTAGTSGNSNGDALHYNAAGQRLLGAAWEIAINGL